MTSTSIQLVSVIKALQKKSTWPVSKVVWGPGQVVGNVHTIVKCLIDGIL